MQLCFHDHPVADEQSPAIEVKKVSGGMLAFWRLGAQGAAQYRKAGIVNLSSNYDVAPDATQVAHRLFAHRIS